MPYDPSFPVTDALLISSQFRSQFTGIVDLIEAIPDGPPGPAGPTGPMGPAVTSYVVDGVTTLDPFLPATVAVSFDGTTVHFSYGIPRGNEGVQGNQGNDGPPGPVGPPFTSFVVVGTTTLDPGQPATVVTDFDGTEVTFNFGIPQGIAGATGPAGPTGPMGEVTTAQLDTAIGGTAVDPSGISALGLVVSDPPTQAEVQAVADKVDALLAALKR